MTAPQTPATTRSPSWPAFATITGFIARAGVTRARTFGLLAFAAIGVVAAALTGNADRSAFDPTDPSETVAAFVDGFVLLLFAPIASLVFATAAFGDLVEDGTLVYLWLRPVRRSVTAAAATAAPLATTLVVVLPVAAVVAAVAGGTGGEIAAAVAAAAVAVVGYVPLFVALGLAVRRALLWGLAYVLIWEGVVVSASDSLARISPRTYSRSVLDGLADVALDAFTVTVPSALVAVALMAACGLAATTWLLRTRDVP